MLNLENGAGLHSAYQERVAYLLKIYYPDLSQLSSSQQKLVRTFWNLDLSETNYLMAPYYSVTGRPARLPSDMLRSVFLMFKTHTLSFTEWHDAMSSNYLYAILAGFEPGSIPGGTTYYDFASRLWRSAQNNLSPSIKKPKEKKVKAPKVKGMKADPVEKISAQDLYDFYRDNPVDPDDAFSLLNKLFSHFIDVSADKGLFDLDDLHLAGDGTPVRASARLRSHHICDCRKKGLPKCNCERLFLQPDCDIGWDSSRECYYFGYDVYIHTETNSRRALPIAVRMAPASEHDSHSFIRSFHKMIAVRPDLVPSQLCLDAAHDNFATYDLCKEFEIQPFIDFNRGNFKGIEKLDYTIGADGHPVCAAGIPMKFNGSEPSKHRIKYRCPKMKNGTTCLCENPCSDAKYGRQVNIPTSSNPRLFTNPPRDSDEWKNAYKVRSDSERCNKRMKEDYRLEQHKAHSTKMWAFNIYAIMMCQHIDAWDLDQAPCAVIDHC